MTSARVIYSEFLVGLPASSSVMSLSEDTSRAPHMPRPTLLWSASVVRSCDIFPKACYRLFFQQCLLYTMVFATLTRASAGGSCVCVQILSLQLNKIVPFLGAILSLLWSFYAYKLAEKVGARLR